jgi:plasmid stabilization system protein ParE
MPRTKEHLNTILNDLYEISPALSESWTVELEKKLSLLTNFPEMGSLSQGTSFISTGRF